MKEIDEQIGMFDDGVRTYRIKAREMRYDGTMTAEILASSAQDAERRFYEKYRRKDYRVLTVS